MWAAGMFLLSARPDTYTDSLPLSKRAGEWGWFRFGALVTCARTCGRLCRLVFMGVCWWLLPAGRSAHTGLRPLRRSWCSCWLSC